MRALAATGGDHQPLKQPGLDLAADCGIGQALACRKGLVGGLAEAPIEPAHAGKLTISASTSFLETVKPCFAGIGPQGALLDEAV
jgi:hypothetical protein